MNQAVSFGIAILTGFFSGGTLFCQTVPRLLRGVDIYASSRDHNSGTANVFALCGPGLGLGCLVLELMKSYVPVAVALRYLDPRNLLFGLVLAAPVLGHGIAPFYHFHGGKCIAVAFGVLLALLPVSQAVLLLAGLYLFFSLVVPIASHRMRSIVVFGLFGVFSCGIFLTRGRGSLALGCLIISLTAVIRHIPAETVAA